MVPDSLTNKKKRGVVGYLEMLVDNQTASEIRVIKVNHTVLGLGRDIHHLLLVRDILVHATFALHHHLSLRHPTYMMIAIKIKKNAC
jgi:hypothetical protein